MAGREAQRLRDAETALGRHLARLAAFVHLDQLPQELELLFEPASRYSLKLDTAPTECCITTNALPAPAPADDMEVIESQHSLLNASFMAVHFGPKLTKAVEGLVAYTAHAYALTGQVYASAFSRARDWSDPTQNLFQQFANVEGIGWTEIVGGCMSNAASFKYGILGGRRVDQSPELVSAFLSDFHDDESFEAAIRAAVAKGRAEGKRNFQVLVLSIRHLVYGDMTPEAVVHSKRYAMWTQPADDRASYLKNEDPRLQELEDVINHGGADDGEWVAPNRRVKNLANPADAEELDTLPNRDLSCFKTKHFCCRYHDDDTLWRQPFEDKGTNWFLFEQVLKSPLGQRIISHPCSLAALWAIVFLVPMGIGGCESSRSRHVRGFNGAGRAVLPRQRLGTYLLMGPRRLRVRVARPSVYFVPRFWPASENTTEGWRQAVAEAKKQTELEYCREADKNNLAVFVVIGTKFRLLHVTEHSKLPTMKKGPRDPFTFNLERDKNAAGGDTEPPWQHCKRMEP
ncbi:hypothetical protein AYO21_11933 [Fonsecaea monophora]|uniref:Uncharacterized protein n=1 Tax=Fonsecaea monophora TaxID=254056 RepID=A0A177EPM2_9EURO|nr:hypothetical protein AYO21_11933 [Fonsecaea monophora]OAG33933.1 hypothetical protein AYO21_11933 [Fonsecaea monophora]